MRSFLGGALGALVVIACLGALDAGVHIWRQAGTYIFPSQTAQSIAVGGTDSSAPFRVNSGGVINFARAIGSLPAASSSPTLDLINAGNVETIEINTGAASTTDINGTGDTWTITKTGQGNLGAFTGVTPPATCKHGEIFVDTDGTSGGSNPCTGGSAVSHLCFCSSTPGTWTYAIDVP